MMKSQSARVIDVSRLISRMNRSAPTGIDRVEFEAIKRSLASPTHTFFLATRGSNSWFIEHKQIHFACETLENQWHHGTEIGHQAAKDTLNFLGSEPVDFGRPKPNGNISFPSRLSLRNLWYTYRVDRLLCRPDVQVTYQNVSHHHLEKTGFLRAMKAKWAARVEIFWHDGIPILFPEYSLPGDSEKHFRRLANVVENADLVQVNSQWTKDEFIDLGRKVSEKLPRVEVCHLSPNLPKSPPSISGARPYFIAVGTIEPRKNTRMLLEIWRELPSQLGPNTPALVLVGRRGWLNAETLALLQRSTSIQPHVFEASDLPDVALASLIQGAKALLMPSFAEGFGLPVAEALELQTPVIASDLNVYGELNKTGIETLSPIDGMAWLQRIKTLAESPKRRF